MQRINVYSYPTDEYDTDGPRFDGHFDLDKAEEFQEDTLWNGNNYVGVHAGDQYAHQILYRTAGGRWVLHRWSQRQGSRSTYEFIANERAREWLLINNGDDVIKKYFGEVEPERGPGRPEVGRPVNIRLDEEVIARLDERAEAEGVSRAEMIRRLVDAALASGE